MNEQQTLQQLLTDRVSVFALGERPAQIIDEHVEKMFSEVIKDAFRSYGDMGKAVQQAVKAALPSNLSEVFELTRYNHMIAKALQETWENSGVEGDMVRRAKEAINEVLKKDELPGEISLRKLIETFLADHKEDAASEGWERPDIRFQESGYGPGVGIFFSEKPKDRDNYSSYSSRNEELSAYSLKNRIHVSFEKGGTGRNADGHEVGSVYSVQIDDTNIGKQLNFRSDWEKMLAALYFGSAKLIVDCEEDDFSYDLYD
ncbi:hypothetical protein [Pseudomonas sp. GV071]|uniref:hypothetical protein n=1 Tax=Pseudomonas sp. GV071 TaxID=2135754 RepID=UPI000D3CE554|nr:hypothetical protein [Pseudomonas sp. GV071]PTQ70380.1 hypothetical protein C8K61_106102 [Pseudomonas sp. GV071]